MPRDIPSLTFDELAARYCERQESTPEQLRQILQRQLADLQPTGWMLCENALLDSSECGRLRILAYGPNCTYKEIPDHPISFDGLASTTSVVVGVLPAAALDSIEAR